MLLRAPGKSAILSANMITRALYTLACLRGRLQTPPERARKPQIFSKSTLFENLKRQIPRERAIWIKMIASPILHGFQRGVAIRVEIAGNRRCGKDGWADESAADA